MACWRNIEQFKKSVPPLVRPLSNSNDHLSNGSLSIVTHGTIDRSLFVAIKDVDQLAPLSIEVCAEPFMSRAEEQSCALQQQFVTYSIRTVRLERSVFFNRLTSYAIIFTLTNLIANKMVMVQSCVYILSLELYTENISAKRVTLIGLSN